MDPLSESLKPFVTSPFNELFLYWSGDPDPLHGLSQFAFVSRADPSSGLLLRDAWKAGVLIFFDAAIAQTGPEQDAVFAEKIIESVRNRLTTGIAWLHHSGAAVAILRLKAAGTGMAAEELASIPVGHCKLNIARNTPVNLDLESRAIQFSNLSLIAPTLFWSAADGRQFGTIGPSVASPDYSLASTGVSLMLTETQFGCWQFPLTLEKDSGRNLKSDMELLDAGLRFARSSEDASEEVADSFTATYPVFDDSASSISLNARLDPLAPFTRSRTFLAFTHAAIPSFFRTRNVVPVVLTPADGAGLAFDQYGGKAGPVSLRPVGDYGLGSKPLELLAGLSGTEFLEIPADSIMRFASLEEKNTAGYVAIVPPSGAVRYFMQSPENLFFRVGSPYPPKQGDNSTWEVLDIPVADIDASVAGSLFYPLAPYAGLRNRTDSPVLMPPRSPETAAKFYSDFEHFEGELLRKRVKIIETGREPGRGDGPAVHGVTPQGLLVEFDSNKAVFEKITVGQGDNRQGITFTDIDPKFAKALRARNIFVVLTGSGPSRVKSQPEMVVELGEWDFDFTADQWQVNGTFALIKYHPLAARDLVASRSEWTWTDTSDSALKDRIRNFVAHVDEGTEPNLEHLRSKLRDPNWQGVLFFNVPLKTGHLPRDLATLSAGLDAASISAHHVGVSLTSVIGLMDDGSIDVKPSSVFAYISSSSPDLVSTERYAYRVTSLEALVVNSTLVNVRATAQLAMNELFGHPAAAQGNAIVHLSGSAQAQNGSVHLPLSGTGIEKYTVQNSVVEEVTIQSVQLFALNDVAPTSAIPNPTVSMRFQFNGSLKFRNLRTAGTGALKQEAFDYFSFDDARFQDMRLDVQFPLLNTDLLDFRFDAAHMTLSPPAPRASGLAQQLTMTFRSFTSSAVADTPQKLNFLPLIVDNAANSTSVGKVWYGLVCAISLGSLGALAPGRTFDLDMLLSWSPPETPDGADSIWFGLRIPGTAGGLFVDIQEVIKLGVKQIVLSKAEIGDGPVLSFQNIGLTVFGKTIPPGGQTSIILFGDPEGKSQSLAWFGAYLKDKKQAAQSNS